MAKFVNRSNGLKTIYFKDGTGVFLKRGQTYETSKSVFKIDAGIVEIQPKPKRRVSASE